LGIGVRGEVFVRWGRHKIFSQELDCPLKSIITLRHQTHQSMLKGEEELTTETSAPGYFKEKLS